MSAFAPTADANVAQGAWVIRGTAAVLSWRVDIFFRRQISSVQRYQEPARSAIQTYRYCAMNDATARSIGDGNPRSRSRFGCRWQPLQGRGLSPGDCQLSGFSANETTIQLRFRSGRFQADIAKPAKRYSLNIRALKFAGLAVGKKIFSDLMGWSASPPRTWLSSRANGGTEGASHEVTQEAALTPRGWSKSSQCISGGSNQCRNRRHAGG